MVLVVLVLLLVCSDAAAEPAVVSDLVLLKEGGRQLGERVQLAWRRLLLRLGWRRRGCRLGLLLLMRQQGRVVVRRCCRCCWSDSVAINSVDRRGRCGRQREVGRERGGGCGERGLRVCVR